MCDEDAVGGVPNDVVRGNYKGIYFQDPNVDKHYIDDKTGAHFDYGEMVARLDRLQFEGCVPTVCRGREANSRPVNCRECDRRVCAFDPLQAMRLLRARGESNEIRSKSFDRTGHGAAHCRQPRPPGDLQENNKYVTFDVEEGPESVLPDIRHSQLDSDVSLGLKKPHARGLYFNKIRKRVGNAMALASDSFVKSTADQRRAPPEDLQKARVAAETGLREASEQLSQPGKLRLCAANRNSLMRNILRRSGKSRNEDGSSTVNPSVALRLSKLPTTESSSIANQKEHSATRGKRRVGLGSFVYKQALEAGCSMGRTEDKH